MCVHGDGYVLTLVASGDVPKHTHECMPETCRSLYHVNTGTGYGPCWSCSVPDRLLNITEYYCSDALDAAETEFRRREAALVGREA